MDKNTRLMRWVDDRRPPDESSVIITDKEGNVLDAFYYENGDVYVWGMEYLPGDDIVAWMDYPAAYVR